MSGKKIVGIILAILGLIGAYYYIGGYFQVKSQFGNVFGVADETLKNYWPMMAASIAVLILGIFLIFKGDDQAIQKNTNSSLIQTSRITTLNFDGDKSLANDSYKIFLVKKYGIEKNDALGKIICQGKLFDDTEQALKHAAQIDGAISGLSTPSNVVHLTEIQKALSKNENTDKQSPLLNDETRRLGITHDGAKYCYKTYQYDQLDDALKFARNDVQITSATKQAESTSSNKKIIVIVVGVIVIIGGYFALQKNSCGDAKADVIRWMNVYTTSLYQGKQGMSVPGASETIAALEIAKKACNKPDLTVEEIINPQAASSSNGQPNASGGDKPNTREVNDLIDKNHIATYDCGEKSDKNACDTSSKTAGQLRAKGYCFGMKNEPRSEWDWHRCNSESLQSDVQNSSNDNSNVNDEKRAQAMLDETKGAQLRTEKLNNDLENKHNKYKKWILTNAPLYLSKTPIFADDITLNQLSDSSIATPQQRQEILNLIAYKKKDIASIYELIKK